MIELIEMVGVGLPREAGPKSRDIRSFKAKQRKRIICRESSFFGGTRP
jgi:hypothetical protein